MGRNGTRTLEGSTSRVRSSTARRCSHPTPTPLLAYDDESGFAEAGQGGFEIRTFIAAAAAARGATGTVHSYVPIPIFAVGCTIASCDLVA